MPVIRIWAVESEYDKEAVGILAKKAAGHFNIGDVKIMTAGARAYISVAKHTRKKPDALKLAVDNYLEQADKVIFVLDADSDAALAQQRNEEFSRISQIEKVISSKKYSGRVFLAMAVQELEAWLLTDSVGICCYFAKSRYKTDCRKKIGENKDFGRLVKKFRKGNTELIVEAESGGKGPKEYLAGFSKEILKILNPNMKKSAIDRNGYRESLAPEIAEHVEINGETLRRNRSFQTFCEYLN